MDLSTLRILLDFGLVVLIWIVQLLVYPSFLYFKKVALVAWHKKYTQGMFFIVAPLMVVQLAIASAQLFLKITVFSTIYAVIAFLLWAITIVQFVPLHGKIADGESSLATLHKLRRNNWLRTCLWTALCIYSILNFTIIS